MKTDFRRITGEATLDALEQGELFALSTEADLNSRAFIRAFMNSDLAATLDSEFNRNEIDKHLILEELNVPQGAVWNYDAMYWAGYMYRYWQFITGASSREIYKIADGEKMMEIYPCGHMLNEERVIGELLTGGYV